MSRMFSAWKSPNSDQMARAQLEQNWKLPNLVPMAFAPLDQNYGLPYFNPSAPTANVAFLGQINSNSRIGEFCKLPHPFENYSYPTGNPCIKNSKISLQKDGLRDTDNPICGPQEKKILIFDRSGNHTRLFFSPSISPQNQFIAPATEKGDNQFLKNPVAEEKWDENDLDDGEGELLENSEEIDALLYSDSDNDGDGDGDDDDYNEVTSTRHIPSIIEDGLPKRQRLLDGGYKKSSWLSFGSPINPCSYKGGDDESSYLGSRNFYEGNDSSERDKKVRIRETLKILGSIVPGSKSDNPVSVIEKAIAYLESMKSEAKALGLTYPGSKSVNFT